MAGAAIALLATLLAGCSGSGPQPNSESSSSAPESGTQRIYFTYQGTEYASFSATGMLTSFTAPVRYKTLTWYFNFSFHCVASMTYNGPPEAESEIACTDTTSGNIFGEYNLHYLAGAQGTDCQTHITETPGGSFQIIGTYQSRYAGGGLRVAASPPANGPQLQALDPCGYPPSVDWNGDINTDGISPNLFKDSNPYWAPHVKVVGTMSGWQGHAEFDSDLFVAHEETPSPPLSQLLQDLMNQIGRWIATQVFGDGQLDVPPEPAPYVDWPFAGGNLSGKVTYNDPTVLIEFNQSVATNTRTQLGASLSSQALAQLEQLSPPPTLNVSVTFTPSHGTPVSASQDYPLIAFPEVTSVTFAGTAADPTITVHGSDFGTLPTPNPSVLEGTNGCPAASGTYGSDYGTDLYLSVPSSHWGAGQYNPGGEVDCIGIVPTSESPSQLTFKLGSFYTANPNMFSLQQGDLVELVVNGASIDVHVSYGSTVSN